MTTLTVERPRTPAALSADPQTREHVTRKPAAPGDGRVFFIVTGVLGAVMFVMCGLAIASMTMAITLSQ